MASKKFKPVTPTEATIEHKLNMIKQLVQGNQGPDWQACRIGFVDCLAGMSGPGRNSVMYMSGWHLALDIYEAWKYLEMVRIDSESPEPV